MGLGGEASDTRDRHSLVQGRLCRTQSEQNSSWITTARHPASTDKAAPLLWQRMRAPPSNADTSTG